GGCLDRNRVITTEERPPDKLDGLSCAGRQHDARRRWVVNELHAGALGEGRAQPGVATANAVAPWAAVEQRWIGLGEGTLDERDILHPGKCRRIRQPHVERPAHGSDRVGYRGSIGCHGGVAGHRAPPSGAGGSGRSYSVPSDHTNRARPHRIALATSGKKPQFLKFALVLHSNGTPLRSRYAVRSSTSSGHCARLTVCSRAVPSTWQTADMRS